MVDLYLDHAGFVPETSHRSTRNERIYELATAFYCSLALLVYRQCNIGSQQSERERRMLYLPTQISTLIFRLMLVMTLLMIASLAVFLASPVKGSSKKAALHMAGLSCVSLVLLCSGLVAVTFYVQHINPKAGYIWQCERSESRAVCASEWHILTARHR